MSTDHRTQFLSALIFFALIASAVFTIPAHADGSSPPPVEPTPTGPSSNNSSTASNVSQVPVALTNPGGRYNDRHKVKLDNQKAAYVTEAGDPIWCPSSMGAPTPGAGACTTNYGDMASLVAYLSSNQKTVDGTIWINGGGPDSSGPNTMDGGAAFATMAAHKLTFKGGWTGIGGTINNSGPSLFSNTLNIYDWGRDIALTDVQFNNVPGNPGRGLFITTSGNLTLNRVQANNNNGWGAFLDNTSGKGVVTLSNSQFNSDAITYDPISLELLSHNAITLTNVSVNSGKGAYIDISTASNKPVTIKTGSFDSNGNHGLVVYSKGTITLTDVSASWNLNFLGTADGAYLDNHCALGCSAPVVLTGSNFFSGNSFSGLYIFSNGLIKMNQITANSNGKADGAYLENDYAGDAGSVTLTGNNTFNSNHFTGLKILSNGAILLSSIFASSNTTGYGVFLNNSGATSAQPITLASSSYNFSSNYLDGLYISSGGAIKLNSMYAVSNAAGDGIYVNNSTSLTRQSVTVTGFNDFFLNAYNGLEILTKGAIKASGLQVIGNGTSHAASLSGAFFENDFPGAIGGVTLTGTNFFTNNIGHGLKINSNGAVSLTN